MSGLPTIHERMEKIRFVFQHALQFSASNDEKAVDNYLKDVEPEFKAVACEGMAMSLALKDLHDRALIDWRAFMRRTEPAFTHHVYVGLGWAIAKQKLSSLIFLDSLLPSMMYRVLDGHGYYDGIFRSVQTIDNQSRPASIEEKYHAGYDQGVGRSLWYAAGGDVDRVVRAVNAFSSDRHAALWRGVGIASTFVGGCDERVMSKLSASSATNRKHLSFGAALAIKARIATNTLAEDTLLTCRVVCNNSVERVNELITGLDSPNHEDTFPLFMGRLIQIETQLATEQKAAGVHQEK